MSYNMQSLLNMIWYIDNLSALFSILHVYIYTYTTSSDELKSLYLGQLNEESPEISGPSSNENSTLQFSSEYIIT